MMKALEKLDKATDDLEKIIEHPRDQQLPCGAAA